MKKPKLTILGPDGQPTASSLLGAMPVMDRLIRVEQFPDIAASIVAYLEGFPDAGITSLIQTDAADVEPLAGSTETVVNFTWRGERDQAWYSQTGTLASFLAKNPEGRWPRKVSMIVEYKEIPQPHLCLGLKVLMFRVRAADDEEGNGLKEIL